MALEVAVYGIDRHRRSENCCKAISLGIRSSGDRPFHVREQEYAGVKFPVAVFYGFTPILRQIMADYVEARLHAVYIDLGYWRREGLHGHHKIVVNSRHPTAYFQSVKHKPDRMRAVGVEIKPWHKGRDILLAGMGDKAANAEGLRTEEFETDAIATIKAHSNRPIIYRPKPSWLTAKPLPQTRWSPKSESLEGLFSNTHAVVTHHSNVAVEAICAGVPAFCKKGVAKSMALSDLRNIESPIYPEGREQWAADIAYTQWSIDEMTKGMPWRHMKSEGLIP
jgi:hypothetical protein